MRRRLNNIIIAQTSFRYGLAHFGAIVLVLLLIGRVPPVEEQASAASNQIPRVEGTPEALESPGAALSEELTGIDRELSQVRESQSDLELEIMETHREIYEQIEALKDAVEKALEGKVRK